MYMEDIDLSLRARLRGYRLLCEPAARIVHDYRPTFNARKIYHPRAKPALDAVPHLREPHPPADASVAHPDGVRDLGLPRPLKGPAFLAARWRGYRWLWRHRSEWRAARKRIQANRTLSDDRLLEASLTSLPFDQLLPNERIARILARLTTPIYALGRPQNRAGGLP